MKAKMEKSSHLKDGRPTPSSGKCTSLRIEGDQRRSNSDPRNLVADTDPN